MFKLQIIFKAHWRWMTSLSHIFLPLICQCSRTTSPKFHKRGAAFQWLFWTLREVKACSDVMTPRKIVQSGHRIQWSNTKQLTWCTDSIQWWRVWECLFLHNSITHEMARPVQWLFAIQRTNKPSPVFQYSETNVMHFLFSLLRIKGLYMFRVLVAHPQEMKHNGTWYTACVLCQLAATRVGVERTLHVSSITCSSSGGATQMALGILRACYVSWLLPE
jgi:hypothetical protein